MLHSTASLGRQQFWSDCQWFTANMAGSACSEQNCGITLKTKDAQKKDEKQILNQREDSSTQPG